MSFKRLGLGCASGQVAGHYNTAAVSEAEHWHENLSSDSGNHCGQSSLESLLCLFFCPCDSRCWYTNGIHLEIE